MPTVDLKSRGVRAALVASVCAVLVVAPAVPAFAVTVVTTGGQLTNAFIGGGSIVLGADITIDGPVTIYSPSRVDLAGHSLSTQAVLLNERLIIDDSGAVQGTWTADAREHTNPGFRTSGTVLVIDGGNVVAKGDQVAAGIGALNNADAGTTIINGGTVTAIGGGGAGIGGAFNGAAGSVQITGGQVTTQGGTYGSGLGSGYNGTGACSVVITGGSVSAQGDFQASGIGGGAFAEDRCAVSIGGGTVFATGGESGAGIGGGVNNPNGPVVISGGDVTAIGGVNAPGVGGGRSGYLTSVTVGEGAALTATGGPASGDGVGGSAIGLDAPGNVDSGFVRVAGTLTVPSGVLSVPATSTLSVASTGVITGGGSLTGTGTIANRGTLTIASVAPGLTVTDNNYAVTFAPNLGDGGPFDPERVYAASFAKANRDLPIRTRAGWAFSRFDTAQDGTGTAFTTTTPLTADLTVHAIWKGDASLTLKPPSTLKAGVKSTFKVTLAKTPGGSTSKPTGTVRVYYSATKYVSVKFTSSGATTLSVTMPALKKGLRTFTVKYLGSSTYAAENLTVTKSAN